MGSYYNYKLLALANKKYKPFIRMGNFMNTGLRMNKSSKNLKG